MRLNSVVLPAPFGPITRVPLARLHRQVDVVDRLEAAEVPARRCSSARQGSASPCVQSTAAIRAARFRYSAGLYFQNCETCGKRVDHRVLQLAVHALDPADVDVLDRVAVLVELHRPARQIRRP